MMRKYIFILCVVFISVLASGCSSREGYSDNYSCKNDSDCVSEAEMSSCYYPCGDIGPCDNSTPKCNILNKEKSAFAICEIGHPCIEPTEIRCIDRRCAGIW